MHTCIHACIHTIIRLYTYIQHTFIHAHITRGGTLCDTEQRLTKLAFRHSMEEQLLLFAQRRLGQFIASHSQDPTQEVLMFSVKCLLADSLHSMQSQDPTGTQDDEPLLVKDLTVDAFKEMIRDVVSDELLKGPQEAHKAPESAPGAMPKTVHKGCNKGEDNVSACEPHKATGDTTGATTSPSTPDVNTHRTDIENIGTRREEAEHWNGTVS